MTTWLNVGRCFVLFVVIFMAAGSLVVLTLKFADKRPKPMMSKTSPVALWLSAAGVFAFLLGVGLAVLPELGHTNSWLALAAGGFLALVGSTFLNAAIVKRRKAAWRVIAAHCTERQLQKKAFWSDSGSRDGWLWRVVCELDYGGKHYVVSPKVRWGDLGPAEAPFWSEEEAEGFIARKISSGGECKLRVNPSNPLEAELL